MKVTIVYGFLGSGKTTFLRRLIPKLKSRERVAVLVNEVGQVGIDGTVLEADEMNVKLLPNGCICCELRGDLLMALQEIEHRFHPDRLIIEPTGLAAPDQLEVVFGYDDIAQFASVDTVAAIVDASRYQAARQIFGTFYNEQIARAGLVLINKADLVDDDALVKAREFVRALNPTASVEATTHCEVDPLLLFRDNGRGAAAVSEGEERGDHDHEVADSTRGLDVLSFQPPPMSEAALEDFLARMCAGEFGEVIRAKGFVKTERGLLRIEYVMGRVDRYEFSGAAPRFEIIGRGLRKASIERAFAIGI